MPRSGTKSEKTITYRRYLTILQRVLQPLGNHVDGSLLDESAMVLGLLVDGQLDLRGQHELGAVYEFALYEIRRDGETAIERYVRTHPPDLSSRDGRLLRALAEARTSVFLIDGVEEGVGIQLHDMLGGPPAFVAEEAYGNSFFLGERFCGRLATVDDVTLSVGGFMPLDVMAMEEILYDLVERFPDSPVDTLHTLSGDDRTDAAIIIARAGMESMDWLAAQALEDEIALEAMNELDVPLIADALPPPPPVHSSRPKRRRR